MNSVGAGDDGGWRFVKETVAPLSDCHTTSIGEHHNHKSVLIDPQILKVGVWQMPSGAFPMRVSASLGFKSSQLT